MQCIGKDLRGGGRGGVSLGNIAGTTSVNVFLSTVVLSFSVLTPRKMPVIPLGVIITMIVVHPPTDWLSFGKRWDNEEADDGTMNATQDDATCKDGKK
ncbi:hypothetical protein ONS96_013206 [Cadophora gregata f. sp. sojae]|nr:hypothetical protein ONS96_013206 [Cadophora gregata f. sp. sojae]